MIFLGGGGGGGYEEYFLGVLEILDISGWTVDAGPEPTYEEQIREVPPPPPGASVWCYVDWRDHLNVKQHVDPDELTYQKSLFKKKKKKKKKNDRNWVTNTFWMFGMQISSFECKISNLIQS